MISPTLYVSWLDRPSTNNHPSEAQGGEYYHTGNMNILVIIILLLARKYTMKIISVYHVATFHIQP